MNGPSTRIRSGTNMTSFTTNLAVGEAVVRHSSRCRRAPVGEGAHVVEPGGHCLMGGSRPTRPSSSVDRRSIPPTPVARTAPSLESSCSPDRYSRAHAARAVLLGLNGLRICELCRLRRGPAPILRRRDGQRFDRRTAHRGFARSAGEAGAAWSTHMQAGRVHHDRFQQSMPGCRCARCRSRRGTPGPAPQPSTTPAARNLDRHAA
jgi:hypothetical protein